MANLFTRSDPRAASLFAGMKEPTSVATARAESAAAVTGKPTQPKKLSGKPQGLLGTKLTQPLQTGPAQASLLGG